MSMRMIMCMCVLAVALAACGKRGAPSPPGPPEDITLPKTYPTH